MMGMIADVRSSEKDKLFKAIYLLMEFPVSLLVSPFMDRKPFRTSCLPQSE